MLYTQSFDAEGIAVNLGADHLTLEGGCGWFLVIKNFFFLAIWWAGYFFPFFSHKLSITFVLHAIFFFRQLNQLKSPTPPPSPSRVKWSAPYDRQEPIASWNRCTRGNPCRAFSWRGCVTCVLGRSDPILSWGMNGLNFKLTPSPWLSKPFAHSRRKWKTRNGLNRSFREPTCFFSVHLTTIKTIKHWYDFRALLTIVRRAALGFCGYRRWPKRWLSFYFSHSILG